MARSLPRLAATAPSRMEVFEAGLAGRARFPESRRSEFEQISPAELAEAIANTRAVRLTLTRLARSLRPGPGRAQVSVRLDLSLFSCDHGWREIARGLNWLLALDPWPEPGQGARDYVAVALREYLGYLRSREQCLGELRTRRAA